MENKTTHGHYLDYYTAWSLALHKASTYIDMKDVCLKGTAFIGILNELLDADKIKAELAAAYITEVNKHTELKFATFLN